MHNGTQAPLENASCGTEQKKPKQTLLLISVAEFKCLNMNHITVETVVSVATIYFLSALSLAELIITTELMIPGKPMEHCDIAACTGQTNIISVATVCH